MCIKLIILYFFNKFFLEDNIIVSNIILDKATNNLKIRIFRISRLDEVTC